jgi:hypothetical protein
MRILWLLLVVAGKISSLFSQGWLCGRPFTLKGSIHVEGDPLGQALVFNENEIIKISSGDTLFNRFSQMAWGPIFQVDASNPLKILVFYKEASRIVFLDNTLSPHGEPIDLIALGYDQAELACTSFDNSLWLYDRLNFRLVRLNAQLQPVVIIPNLNQILNGQIQLCRLKERNNRLYVSAFDGTVYVFDVYGSFLFSLRCPEACRCHPFDEGLRFIEMGNLVEISFKTKRSQILTSAPKSSQLVDWVSEKKAIVKISDNTYQVCRVP